MISAVRRIIYRVSVFTSVFALSLSTHAANFTVPESIQVLSIDGKKIEHGFFSNLTEFSIDKGQHKVLMTFKTLIESDEDDHVVFRSAPFGISFHLLTDQDVQLSHTALETQEQARAFAQKPQVNLTTDTGQSIPIQLVRKKNETETLLSRLDRSLNASMAQQQTQRQLSQAQSTQALEMLNFWWNKASQAEKEAFLEQHQQR
ncbi:DUF2057 domain-containing protein [Algicola sagamiensis]|uniref:DUF2057 domain-containing protein n=1 Tax=Algicola sagamiensis TaxID=163869 RepID=UPI00036901BE|nr:DUF2057 domain-containing protein [Algicola sagamiensis]